tara:strand:- start:8 stop:475 length:468 start_codon:yes stop_codon:yes gene_type:complete
MMRRLLIAAAAIASMATPVGAQIPGVRFGQTVAEVQAVVGNIAPVTITSSPGAQIIFTSSGYVAFCDGKAVAMQYRLGESVNDFAAEVEEETARTGEPRFSTDNFRTADGPMSTVTVRWDFSTYKLEVGMLQSPGSLSVTRTVTARDSSCISRAY